MRITLLHVDLFLVMKDLNFILNFAFIHVSSMIKFHKGISFEVFLKFIFPVISLSSVDTQPQILLQNIKSIGILLPLLVPISSFNKTVNEGSS